MSGRVIIKVGEEEELRCPACGKAIVTAEGTVFVHTKTDTLRIPMMVMGDSDLIVMVVSERNDHHDRSEATLTL